MAFIIFLCLAGGGVVLWLAAKGTIHLGFWLGVCGFKQRHGLPCPGCGWTHATQLFLTGQLREAFMTQPAAVFFCVIAGLTAVFSLLIAVFGIKFAFLRHLFEAIGIKILVLVAVIVILAGWLVTLSRVLLHGDGF